MNEAEKEQALKLSGLYKELAEKGTWFEVNDIVGVWQKTDICPTLNSTLSEWRVADKPVAPKKIIDLTKMVGSDVDMEFGNGGSPWLISKYENKTEQGYMSNLGPYSKCRIRQNHIHYYDGRENPLPDGLLVKLYFSNYTPTTYKSQNIDWVDMFFCLHNIKGFEVLEVLPEYKYGWEK